MHCRPTEITIDLSAIAGNARALAGCLPGGTRLMAVVKADAYGHGLVPAARAALTGGARALAVAIPEEGAALREAGVTAPILVLGGVDAAGARASARWDLTQTVFSPQGVCDLERAAAALDQTACAHLKIDTGMGRIGVRDERQLRAVLAALNDAPHVRLTGAFTHFAAADIDPDDARAQYARFMRLSALLPAGIALHACNSAGILCLPEAYGAFVRAGIALYGCPPVETSLPLRPALRFATRAVYVKDIERGDTVSYGRTFTARASMRVATLPVGYGDGYHRACSGRASVLIRGQLAPVLGRVCMDQMIVDVTDIPGAREGDEAVLLGAQGGRVITAAQLGEWAGTISYEVLLAPTARVPRRYIG